MDLDVPNVALLHWKLPLGSFALTIGWQLNALELAKGLKKKNTGMSVDIDAGSEILEVQASIHDRFQP